MHINRRRKRGALTSTPLSIHHIMLTINAYNFTNSGDNLFLTNGMLSISGIDDVPVDNIP